MHFALEEALGYFDGAVAASPELSCRAESLRGEHSVLYVQICDIGEKAEQMCSVAAHRKPICQLVALTRTFSIRLHEHERGENDLILQAYDEDVGVGD